MSTNKKQKRLRFDRVEVLKQEDGLMRVSVAFTYLNRLIQASASATNDETGQLKAAALATLDAIRQAAENCFTCELADLDRVNALGKDLIAVLVNIDFQGKQLQVFGSCQIADSEIDAAVKAALNATNRMFELAIRET
ncbi:MAG TPA: hypothetical protein VID27_01000 [Blastocatellia bacterium]